MSQRRLAPVLDLLIVDESNPKSLAFQFSPLVAHVEHLPRQSDRRFASPEERLSLEMLTAVRLLDLTGLRCRRSGAQTESLAAFLDLMDTRLKDFAHVAISCLRALGLAARYVSGYLETLPPPGKPRLVGADASHAWIHSGIRSPLLL